MNLEKKRFARLIKGCELRELFNELGWDHAKKKEPIKENDEIYELDAIAAKRDFGIFVCPPEKTGKIPQQNVRRKIDRAISKKYFEHLIIYVNEKKTQQIWQLVIKEPNKPVALKEIVQYSEQFPELLLQKLSGLFFSIDEEEKISLPDVKERVLNEFNTNAEKVTKRFYERFQKELAAFTKFIEGVEEKVQKEWYASLMLNRLMFIYFIQKKGFLDKNKNYLSDKLRQLKEKWGKDKFHTFYKNFLLVLFHEGLGSPKQSKQTKELLGIVPYLNGGLFEVHQIEERNKDINIEDKAFERIFDFFDEYNWHLDNSPTATGKDINPDVIGYIFEKYINDRAAMGAYYTKEDITEYISKNTIIPRLFDKIKEDCANAFKPESSLWKMLKEDPDRYIYDAVKKGVNLELPAEIKIGINPKIQKQIVKNGDKTAPKLLELRCEWNKTAPEDYALPTEIWREVVERRNRYFEIRTKIENGEIKEINDFITYNLNIRQFAQDAVEQYEGSDFVEAFYKAIESITILDPTCGSGAFLFAALNILEPLYEACISRMRGFIEADGGKAGKKHPNFRNVIKKIEDPKHANEKYYIYKTIILNNLYGVDIMKEATEIAKLRLFLKLVAEVEADYARVNLGLEPLPDIDFNIKSGNSLIGFVNFADVKKVDEGGLGFEKEKIAKINEEAEIVSMAFSSYKEVQMDAEKSLEDHISSKKNMQKRLKKLNEELNVFQASLYIKTPKRKTEFEDWLETHKPFHWFVEFYDIIQCGGFDVVLGNPPYVETQKVNYSIKNYKTLECGNLYAYVVERNNKIVSNNGKTGMIIPHSAICTERMAPLLDIFTSNNAWLTTYDIRPSKLFDGVDQRLLIYLISYDRKSIKTSKYHRWASEYRQSLFSNIRYVENKLNAISRSLMKSNSEIETEIQDKIVCNPILNKSYGISNKINYHNAPRYFIRAMSKVPYFWNEKNGEKASTQIKSICFNSEKDSFVVGSVLNSNLFYWWYIMYSDCRHLNNREIDYFPFSVKVTNQHIYDNLNSSFIELTIDYENNKVRKNAFYKATGNVEYDEYYPKQSKVIIDKIDTILAEHYGFTEEELDFIINYDIKYRMGKELEEE